jgi:predicted methyltransferase
MSLSLLFQFHKELETMIRRLMIIAVFVLTTFGAAAEEMSTVGSVEQAMWGSHRSDSNMQRNRYRHPVGTLEFFGLEQGMTVMEIWPGGGWYTEILAPVIRYKGQFIVATWDPEVEGQPDYRYRLPKQMAETFAANPDVYDQVETRYFSPPESASLGDANSIDMVLTFRNTHGWVSSGQAQDMFNEFARVLMPGGVLGVVQHRAPDDSDMVEMAKLGYVSEKTVIELAEKAGLVLDARSEINANPRDTKDHEQGVWTLPPSLTLGEKDREKYLAIGESDRMTLRFKKPDESSGL